MTRLLPLILLIAPLARAAEPDAKQLYEEGARHYQVESYDAAIDAFKRAYVLSANAGLLYNIAQSYRFKGEAHCADALKYYQSYLDKKPGASDRKEVVALISKMEECVQKHPRPLSSAPVEPVPAPVPSPQPLSMTEVKAEPRADAPTRGKTLPLVLAGAGLIVALGGGGLEIAAHVRFGQLQTTCPCPRETWTPWQGAETAGWVLVASGAAIAAGSFLWWLLDRVPSDVQVSVSPLGIWLGGTFEVRQ